MRYIEHINEMYKSKYLKKYEKKYYDGKYWIVPLDTLEDSLKKIGGLDAYYELYDRIKTNGSDDLYFIYLGNNGDWTWDNYHDVVSKDNIYNSLSIREYETYKFGGCINIPDLETYLYTKEYIDKYNL